MRLKHKVTLIAGRAAGIGRTHPERFAQEGPGWPCATLNEEGGHAPAGARFVWTA